MFFPTQGHHVLVSYIVTDLHTDIYIQYSMLVSAFRSPEAFLTAVFYI